MNTHRTAVVISILNLLVAAVFLLNRPELSPTRGFSRFFWPVTANYPAEASNPDTHASWTRGFSRFFWHVTANYPAEASNPDTHASRTRGFSRFFWHVTAANPAEASSPGIGEVETAVLLASPSDPYYPLAEEIAQAESLSITGTLDEALARKPAFLLWVASPASLSDRALAAFGTALLEYEIGVSVGIFSGSTLEEARSLWQRAEQARDHPAFAVNGTYPSAGVPRGRILAFDGENVSGDLTKASLQEDLQQAGYLTFTGHGGSRYWRLDEGLEFTARDLPSLPATVVGTASCQTFRLWNEGSIALAFAGNGAAAYAGFAFSPNEGYLIGEFDGLPFRYTWPGFPIGHIVQVQNRGTLQGFARFPYYFLLGDPRIALQDRSPYQLTADRQEGRARVLHFTGAPPGLIPVRIPGGAPYRYAEIPGVAAASTRDPFYNARLQMADTGDDKLVLFAHTGGDFTIRLLPRPPLTWLAADLLADSLDHTLIYLPGTGGNWIALIFAVIPGLWLARSVRRRRLSLRMLRAAFLSGALLAGLHGLYAIARAAEITVTSKPVQISYFGFAGTFLLGSLGAALFFQARSHRVKLMSLLVAAFPALAPALFSLAVVALFNLVYARPMLGTDVYNYAMTQMALIAFLFEALLFGLAFDNIKLRIDR